MVVEGHERPPLTTRLFFGLDAPGEHPRAVGCGQERAGRARSVEARGQVDDVSRLGVSRPSTLRSHAGGEVAVRVFGVASLLGGG